MQATRQRGPGRAGISHLSAADRLTRIAQAAIATGLSLTSTSTPASMSIRSLRSVIVGAKVPAFCSGPKPLQ